MATGGEAIARLPDGRVVFVSGACADESVRIEITERKKRFARGTVLEVLDASPDRQELACTHAARECGGCDWMHLSLPAQRAAKLQLVREQLERLGGVTGPDLRSAEMERGRRTTVRCSVREGRAGYRGRGSHDVFAADQCGATHPLVEELIVDGRFGQASEVTLRVSAATGERLVITNGEVTSVSVPVGVRVVSADDPGGVAFTERVAGREWHVSALSFFQTSDTGAEALVAAVAGGVKGSTGDVVDLYAGVGLLGGGACADRLVVAVESSASSAADARKNLGESVTVAHERVERWKPTAAEVVLADPARRGLNQGGVRAIQDTGASLLVLVSCDPASLGRDTALLREQGWAYDRGEVVDMFPDTSQIEVVSVFSR